MSSDGGNTWQGKRSNKQKINEKGRHGDKINRLCFPVLLSWALTFYISGPEI